MTQTIGIYIYDNVEVLDFAGPFEVCNVATRAYKRLHPKSEQDRFKVVTIAENSNAIVARGELRVIPHVDITSHPPLDVLIVPGGIHEDEMNKSNVIDWIRTIDRQTKVTASVCTGAFLLAKAGILDGLSATTHWMDTSDLRTMFPSVNVKENVRWIDEGHIVTSAGISAGIDMALHLVSRLESDELAVQTARQMEYDWQKR